jgi:hypothetical protein
VFDEDTDGELELNFEDVDHRADIGDDYLIILSAE